MEQYVYTIFTKKHKINRFTNHAKHGCHENIVYDFDIETFAL